MSMKTLAAACAFAGLACAAGARPTSTTPDAGCVVETITHSVDAVGGGFAGVQVKAFARNACFPSTDLTGQAELVIDGVVVQVVPFDGNDVAVLGGYFRMDTTGVNEICVRTRATFPVRERGRIVRKTLQDESCVAVNVN